MPTEQITSKQSTCFCLNYSKKKRLSSHQHLSSHLPYILSFFNFNFMVQNRHFANPFPPFFFSFRVPTTCHTTNGVTTLKNKHHITSQQLREIKKKKQIRITRVVKAYTSLRALSLNEKAQLEV